MLCLLCLMLRLLCLLGRRYSVKDGPAMLAHHMCTLGLVLSSYALGFTRIGA